MRARRGWLVAAVAAAAVATLAPPAGAETRRPERGTATPVERTIELMGALETHRYNAACDVYDPVFWEVLGFGSGSCASVLRKSFPSSDPVAHRVEFGGRIGPRMAVVIVSMALGDAAPFCGKVWESAPYCPSASTYHLKLALKTLLVDWRGREVATPQSRWYVTSVGGV